MVSSPYGQPLTQFKLLEADDLDAAQGTLSQLYGEMRLTAAGPNGSFAARLNAAPLGRLTLVSLLWYPGVECRADHLDGCFDFAVAHDGSGNIRIGRRDVEFQGKRGVVVSPSHSLHVLAREPLITLNVKVPQQAAQTHLRALTGNDVSQPLDFDPEMRLEGSVAGTWRLVDYIVGELEREPGIISNPLVQARLSDAVLTSLLFSQPHNYADLVRTNAYAAEPSYLRRVEEYMEAHCDQPITAEVLAEVAGVSLSALYAGFRRHRNYTAMEFLKSVRMRRVRDALLTAAPGSSVRECALKWGFHHMGRFSADYKRQFGESPSETLRGSR